MNEVEVCDKCNAELESSQIGICDGCRDPVAPVEQTRAHFMNEALQWSKGALNCYFAAKVDGQGYIGGYVASQVRLVRQCLAAARLVPKPALP